MRMKQIELQQWKMELNYMMTYTQGNMTTNYNNVSVSKMELNQQQGRYKSANKGKEKDDLAIEASDLQNIDDQNGQILPQELQKTNQYETQVEKRLKKNKKNNKQPTYKKQMDLQIEIPNSDEERKARLEAKQKKLQLLQQQQLQKQSNQQNSDIENGSKQSKNDSKAEGMENQESARVNDIIRNNKMDVENLETIQIDYDYETIEGLTDDQCLELYCEGSVKLKNSSRLHCKLAFETLLIDKIRSTTRLVYANLGITNNGNLNSSDFIADYIVAPLKRENIKFKSSGISEAFTVQCSDYIHFNIRKVISRSIKIYLLLSLIILVSFILKVQDPSYGTDVSAQSYILIICLLQFAASYFYFSGIYSCSNDYIRRSLFFNQIYFIANIFQLIYEGISQSYFSDLVQNSLHTRENFEQIIYYYFSFLMSIIIPPYINKLNKTTTTSIRKIVKIVSDEYFD